MKEKRRLQKEGISTQDAGSDAGDEDEDDAEGGNDMDGDDLFGEGPDAMDIG